jgi:hypothetical protein
MKKLLKFFLFILFFWFQQRHLGKRLKRNLIDESQARVDLGPGTAASSASTSLKRPQESKSVEPRGDGTIFAAVDRIGPPRKKRRQESELPSRETQNKEPQSKEPQSRPTAETSKLRKDKTGDFAAALGAAINQAAESANRSMKGRKHRKGDVEEVKNTRPGGDSISMRQFVIKSSEEKSPSSSSLKKPALVNSADLKDTAPLSLEGPILVNVADLQDIITNAAEQVAKKIVDGNSSTIALATKTAVTMMTNYAATGKFVQGNTHIEFPSVRLKNPFVILFMDLLNSKTLLSFYR